MKSAENILELRHIEKCYVKDTPVVEDFNLIIKKGEFVTLLGPSGCGKTTILRMLAGFEQPTSGKILSHGRDISMLAPHERQINTVFQKYALFPHLNIYDNIAFGLRQKKMQKEDIENKVKRVLEIVDLEGFEKRKTHSLSGGQQQRIAIARAIVNEPDILLLDEPLGALDYKMRQEMQLELKAMHQELGITFVFVTHDQEEALTMSDKIVVMSKGVLQQTGRPEDIYLRPANAFVADFIGESNLFNGRKASTNKVEFAGAEFECRDKYPAGTEVDTMIRPEFVSVTVPENGELTGEVVSSVFKGKYYEITIQSGKNEFVAQSTQQFESGVLVGIKVDSEGIHNMPRNLRANHLVGTVNDRLELELNDTTIPVDVEKLVPGAYFENGEWYNVDKTELELAGKEVEIYFPAKEAQLSDDADEGIFRGHITTIIYVGDHYRYTVTSDSKSEYYATDEYLWNIGDFVSIVVPNENISWKFAEK